MQRSARPANVKRILLLFFTTMALSLVILIVLFNLFFKNIDIEFDTKMPEQAPVLDTTGDEGSTETEESTENNTSWRFVPRREARFQEQNVIHAVVTVPGQWQRSPVAEVESVDSKKKVG